MGSHQKNVRIGNVSGATGDAAHAMFRMARDANLDVITGDWLSEMNIAWNAISKAADPTTGYEAGFLTQLEESIDLIVKKRIKVVTNAGALNTTSLLVATEKMLCEKGYGHIKVATVSGDDVTEQVLSNDNGHQYDHLDHGNNAPLKDWHGLKPTNAAAYIGAWGIVESLNHGADIVLCGRVTDASPVIGAAAWWHGWNRDSYDELASILIAGHLIECGTYATGANFSGFKDYLPDLVDLAFPIAEILPDGSFLISKCEEHTGTVNRFNLTAQLLYELQGEMYLNPDVVADIRTVRIEATLTPNTVRVSEVRGYPPPPTTKVMIAAPGGYQAEATYYINGLDVEQKTILLKRQVMNIFKNNNFSKLSVDLYGTQTANPQSQAAGTVMLRVFAQARSEDDISIEKFKQPIYSLRMQIYPGHHMNLDFRTMAPRRFMEIFPSTIPQVTIDHRATINGKVLIVPPPPKMTKYPRQRPSYETTHPVNMDTFGPTQVVPLGSVVHARSGDKANNSNVGFFVRNEDEYSWLQSFMTVDRIKGLFGDDWTLGDTKRRVERCEFPKILAVHFRILDFLDGGIASSSRIDGLGKGVGEYLRSKHVEVPVKFLERGWI